MLRLPTLCLVLALLPVASAGAKSPPDRPPQAANRLGPAAERSARAFVQSFYNWYLGLMKGEHTLSPEDRALKARPSSFSRELRRALAEDAAAAAKHPDEIVGLDFDPFVNAQDIADRYVVKRITRKGSGYLVEVHAMAGKEASPTPDVIPELVPRRGGGWTFVNFHYRYPDDRSRKEDLLNTLKQLKEGRGKGK